MVRDAVQTVGQIDGNVLEELTESSFKAVLKMEVAVSPQNADSHLSDHVASQSETQNTLGS
jgi:hypothetical protein